MSTKLLFHRIVILCLAGSLFIAAKGQSSLSQFASNIVKIESDFGIYGFVTATDKMAKTSYFIIVKKQNNFSQSITVLLGKYKKNKQANVKETAQLLVHAPINGSGYSVGLYQLNIYVNADLKYFHAADLSSTSYMIFGDAYKTTQDLFNIVKNPTTVKSTTVETGNSSGNLFFSMGGGDNIALGGSPVIDATGNLVGIVTQTNNEKREYFEAIDIGNIIRTLSELNGECKYFNIIEKGSPNDETSCETKERVRIEKEKQAIAEQKRKAEEAKAEQKRKADEAKAEQRRKAEQARQEDLLKIVTSYESGNRDPEVRKIYHKQQDRLLALSIGGNGNFSLMYMKPPVGNKVSADAFGFALGPNIYINPDKGKLRVVLKPRYAVSSFDIESGYKYNDADNFHLKNILFKSYELPIQLDIITSRKDNKDEYLAFGYGVAKNISTQFSYLSGETKRSEPVFRNVTYSQHAYVEIGESRGRIRYSFYIRYQINDFLKKDYEFVVNNEAISPFRDPTQHYLQIGIEFQLRLWNRWLNDYRTKF